MRNFVRLLIFGWLMIACRNNPSDTSEGMAMDDNYADSIAAVQFPILIEGGTRAVYKFAKMTPRGLRFFLDTVDYHGETLIPDSIKKSFIFRLSISNIERDTVPCVIAVSKPGYWNETIIGTIGNNGYLRMNYKNTELRIFRVGELVFKPGNWSAVFRNDSIKVELSAELEDTKIGDHLGGKGRIRLLEKNKLIEDEEIFVVYNKHQIITQIQ